MHLGRRGGKGAARIRRASRGGIRIGIGGTRERQHELRVRVRGSLKLAEQGRGDGGAEGARGGRVAEAPEGFDLFGGQRADFVDVEEGGEGFYAGRGGGDLGDSRGG